MSSENLHAPRERLTAATLSHHQAIVSLMEEIEAADWYRQRADDCDDATLREILLHNMREEIEHASMILEWLRRNVPEWASNMDTYLYSEGGITEVEEAMTGGTGGEAGGAPPEAKAGPAGGLTVGSLKGGGD